MNARCQPLMHLVLLCARSRLLALLVLFSFIRLATEVCAGRLVSAFFPAFLGDRGETRKGLCERDDPGYEKKLWRWVRSDLLSRELFTLCACLLASIRDRAASSQLLAGYHTFFLRG